MYYLMELFHLFISHFWIPVSDPPILFYHSIFPICWLISFNLRPRESEKFVNTYFLISKGGLLYFKMQLGEIFDLGYFDCWMNTLYPSPFLLNCHSQFLCETVKEVSNVTQMTAHCSSIFSMNGALVWGGI